MQIEFQPIDLDEDGDNIGRLVLRDGRLAAVLSQLSSDHAARTGLWFMECGFGVLARCDMEFEDLESARAWIEARLTNPS
jgi:hypothetical protein